MSDRRLHLGQKVKSGLEIVGVSVEVVRDHKGTRKVKDGED